MNLKKIGKVFTNKFVWTGPSSYEKKNLPARGLTKVEKHWYRLFLNCFLRVYRKRLSSRITTVYSKTVWFISFKQSSYFLVFTFCQQRVDSVLQIDIKYDIYRTVHREHNPTYQLVHNTFNTSILTTPADQYPTTNTTKPVLS